MNKIARSFLGLIVTLVLAKALSSCGTPYRDPIKDPAASETTIGQLMNSMMPRMKALGEMVFAKISEEAAGNISPTQYTDVPDLNFANDAPLKRKTHLNLYQSLVQSASSECGLTGDIETRIGSCSVTWNGEIYGTGSEGLWKLVTRRAGQEVWRDERTKLLWSDVSATTFNWCEASGYTTHATVGAFSYTCDTNHSSVCAPIQDSDPSNATQFNSMLPAKAQLGVDEHIAWRLPTLNDFKLADLDGIVGIYSGADGAGSPQVWTATPTSNQSDTFYIVNPNPTPLANSFSNAPNSSPRNVRCVGREAP